MGLFLDGLEGPRISTNLSGITAADRLLDGGDDIPEQGRQGLLSPLPSAWKLLLRRHRKLRDRCRGFRDRTDEAGCYISASHPARTGRRRSCPHCEPTDQTEGHTDPS